MKSKMRYIYFSTVEEVYEHEPVVRGEKNKENGETILITENRGWFVLLSDSHEATNLGDEKPDLAKGDRIRHTLEKI